MQILKITPAITKPQQNQNNNYTSNIKEENITGKNYYELPNYQSIAFLGIRVDKGLERFFRENKKRMPAKVISYIENLADRLGISPLEAQKNAYAKLSEAQTVTDIKRIFPHEEEPLFDYLKDPIETKATRGILSTYRENRQLLDMFGKDILESKENLTVYLVKKIYLEGKTLDEINIDIEKDMDKDFLELFQKKNPNYSRLIQESTLKSLGIQSPDASYQQSLRYTREGYSDLVGENISKAQRLFWDSLTPEQRTARAKKTVERFEKWWAGISYSKKLEMIAQQDEKLAMLKDFNASGLAKGEKTFPATSKATETQPSGTHTRVGSAQLSKDELFIRWAENNLKIFKEGLSDSEKQTIEAIRIRNMVNRWAEMSPAQKSEYIQKLKSGAEPIRYAMIDAWNNSREIILELSRYMKENQIFKPHNVLYSSDEFSEFQSRLMTEFWEQHPDYAAKLGEQIKLSQEKVKDAIAKGHFEVLKKEIMRDQNRRINEIVAIKIKPQNETPKPETTQATKAAEVKPIEITYKDDFIDAIGKTIFGKIKNQPAQYVHDYPRLLADELPEDIVKLWTKYLRGEVLSYSEAEKLNKAISVETTPMAKMNRAFEAAMADTVARFTGSPKAYELSQSDLKTVMYHLERGEQPIQIVSHKNNMGYVFNIVENPKKIDKKQINKLYEQYYKELSPQETDDIIRTYFAKADNVPNETLVPTLNALIEYISTYGRSIFIAFSDKSKYSPVIKNAFNDKFLIGMPDLVKQQSDLKPLLLDIKDFKREEYLAKMRYQFSKKYEFLPSAFTDLFYNELAQNVRIAKDMDIRILDAVCQRRLSAIDKSRMIILRDRLALKHKPEILAMEQAMADILYDATKDVRVYNLKLETLMDKMELFRVAKDFPTVPTPCVYGGDDATFSLAARKRPNTALLKQKYTQYLEELKEYQAEIKDNKPEHYNEILFILNPNNDEPMIDLYTGMRMATFGLNTNIGKVGINPAK